MQVVPNTCCLPMARDRRHVMPEPHIISRGPFPWQSGVENEESAGEDAPFAKSLAPGRRLM